MKPKFWLILLALTGLAVLYYSLSEDDSSITTQTTSPAAFRQQTKDKRTKKNEFFRTSTDSPIADKKAFAGLAYFDADPTYRVTARLELFADKSQKTGGQDERWQRRGLP